MTPAPLLVHHSAPSGTGLGGLYGAVGAPHCPSCMRIGRVSQEREAVGRGTKRNAKRDLWMLGVEAGPGVGRDDGDVGAEIGSNNRGRRWGEKIICSERVGRRR